jgi:hypothetical protein
MRVVLGHARIAPKAFPGPVHAQVASFERNPFTALPNYRLKVLQLLPSLQSLEGQVCVCARVGGSAWCCWGAPSCVGAAAHTPLVACVVSQAVSAHERGRVGATLQQEAACMAVMLSNACMVHKLVGALRLPGFVGNVQLGSRENRITNAACETAWLCCRRARPSCCSCTRSCGARCLAPRACPRSLGVFTRSC